MRVLRRLPLRRPDITYGSLLQRHLTAGLLVAFAVLWPLAGWPWWPVIVAVGVVLVLRILTFDRLLSGWTGVLAAGILAVWCVPYVSVWTVLTAVGAGGVLVGLLRLPRWHVLVLAVAVLIPGAVGFTWERIQASRAAEAALEQEGQEAFAHTLPTNGWDAVDTLHVLLAEGTANPAEGNAANFCRVFSPVGAAQFAAAVHAVDCPTAFAQLARQVSDAYAYMHGYQLDDNAVSVTGDAGTVDACAVTWQSGVAAGPRLGRLELRRLISGDGGYLITGYQPCGPASTSSLPSTTTTPAILPGYAPTFAADLLTAIAGQDYGVCGLFNTTGAAQFAAAAGAASCQEAIAKLHHQVSDPTRYATPTLTSYTATSDVDPVVDGCHLDWSGLGNAGPPPGPQLGWLTLAPQTGGEDGCAGRQADP